MAFFRWLRTFHPDLAKLAFAIPNAARRSPRLGAWLKEEGMRAGVWDVFIPFNNKACSGLWIEFKIKPNRLTTEQKTFQGQMELQGYRMVAAYTLTEAQNAVGYYLSGF